MPYSIKDARAAMEVRARVVELERLVEELAARVAVLEARRGPGRPPKQKVEDVDHLTN